MRNRNSEALIRMHCTRAAGIQRTVITATSLIGAPRNKVLLHYGCVLFLFYFDTGWFTGKAGQGQR